MGFNERFVHGRLRRRVLRAPALDGWLADEAGRPPERTELALKKVEGDCLALPIPESTGDLARLSPAATAA
ncbi:MAG TPA: hypothetical protein VL172_06325, partial [Kofleriaceae bacterium]|nr:hypothetical protein [Kofleriaceae bacterium]